MKTQGVELYVLDTTVSPVAVLKIAEVTGIDSLGGQASDIDRTTLDDLRYRRFETGLIDPGSSNVGMFYDKDAESHQFMHDNAGGESFRWAIGGPEAHGTPPGVAVGGEDFDLTAGAAETRTWWVFDASVNQHQFSFAIDDLVKMSDALRISGEIELTPGT